MIYLIAIVLYFAGALFVGGMAKEQDRSFFLWFFLAVVLDPILPLIALLIMK